MTNSAKTYLIAGILVALTAAGYFIYRSMLVKPDINIIGSPSLPIGCYYKTTQCLKKPCRQIRVCPDPSPAVPPAYK